VGEKDTWDRKKSKAEMRCLRSILFARIKKGEQQNAKAGTGAKQAGATTNKKAKGRLGVDVDRKGGG